MNAIAATLLIIVLADGKSAEYYTETCDAHLHQLENQIPDAEIYCVHPRGYSMRPIARPADLMERG